jgi:hypothetical protein
LPIQTQHTIHIIIQIKRQILILLVQPFAFPDDRRDTVSAFFRCLLVGFGGIFLLLQAIPGRFGDGGFHFDDLFGGFGGFDSAFGLFGEEFVPGWSRCLSAEGRVGWFVAMVSW